MIPLATQILNDRRLNGTAIELAGLAREVESQIIRSAIARAHLRLVLSKLARKETNGRAEEGR